MPMMMEDVAFTDGFDDMDDLFIEAQSEIESSSTKIDKKLIRRLEELSVSGCCQKISWSKFSSIASINEVEPGVSVRGFVQYHDKGQFDLTDPVSIEFPPLYDTRDIVHICWSHTGLDLAVVDRGGRVHLFTILVCVNRLGLLGSYTPSSTDTLEAVVGLEWLCPHRPFEFCPAAIKNGDTWSYPYITSKIGGPVHPQQNRQALSFVTRGGKVNLMYIDSDSVARNVSAPLGMSGYIDSLLTHASFALEQDGSMLLATYDVLETLRIYRLTVDWNLPVRTKEQPEQPDPPAGYRLQPSIEIIRLSSKRIPDSRVAPSPGKRMGATVLHLKVLPATAPAGNEPGTPSTILALRAVIGPSFSFLDVGTLSPETLVARWEVHETEEELNSSFQQLSIKRKKSIAAVPEKSVKLKQLDSVRLRGVVNYIDTARFNRIMCFCKTDGSIEFRDRISLSSIDQNNTDTVESLVHVGFHMLFKDPSFHTCLSPNACISISKDEADKLHIRYLEPPHGFTDLDQDDPAKLAINAGFSLIMASASCQHYNSDDVLSLLQRHRESAGVEHVLNGLCISLDIPVDSAGTETPEKLLRSHIILRALSFQNSLGRQGRHRSISSKLASVILSLRSSSWALHHGFTNAGAPQHRPTLLDLPTSLIGVAKWYFDLMVFVLAELLNISRHVKGRENDLPFIQDYINQHKSPSIALLLSSIPRVLLRYASRCLRSLITVSQKYSTMTPIDVSNNDAPSHNIQVAWRTLLSIAQASPIDPRQFETALEDVDYHVKASYKDANFDEGTRVAAERKMLITGMIPEVLTPVVTRLVTVTLERLADVCDITEVKFADTLWLGLGESNSDSNYGRRATKVYDESNWDVLRRVPMMIGVSKRNQEIMPLLATNAKFRKRRCTRCGAHMEDLFNPKQMQMPLWIMQLQKGCICGCPWVRISSTASATAGSSSSITRQ